MSAILNCDDSSVVLSKIFGLWQLKKQAVESELEVAKWLLYSWIRNRK